jgi:hypothetical protein
MSVFAACDPIECPSSPYEPTGESVADPSECSPDACVLLCGGDNTCSGSGFFCEECPSLTEYEEGPCADCTIVVGSDGAQEMECHAGKI